MSANRRHTRRKRRQQKAALKFGPDAKPKHRSPSGRTGRVRSVRLKSRKK